MRFEIAVFDLDGTILDTLADLSASLNHALAQCGYPARTLDEARRFVGNGIHKLVERGVPAGTDEACTEAVFAAFKAYYALHSRDATRPYDGVPALLRRLKAGGMKLAVVSNKLDGAVKELCRYYYPGIFDTAVGEREGVRRKPAPDALFQVLDELDVPAERAVYIGDSDVDIQTAQNAHLPSISVAWGFRDEAFLRARGASVIVRTPAELYEKLC